MPIIEPVGPEESLTQGDVLRGTNLYITTGCENGVGGVATERPVNVSVVLSRPCHAVRGESLVVVGVQRISDRAPAELKTFTQIRKFLEARRDGNTTPNLFYLGQIPGEEGQFCARFDALHTITVPTPEVKRKNFISHYRIGRLNAEFARDFHLRMFRAFASLGFDDHSWMATADLEWLVKSGRAEIAAAEVGPAKAVAEGDEIKAKHLKQLQDLKDSVELYTVELARRPDNS